MTTFYEFLLSKFDLLLTDLSAVNSTLNSINNNTQNGNSSNTNANSTIEYHNGIGTVNIAPTIQLSLFVFRGNGTLILNTGNVPLPRSFVIDYPFVSTSYIYPALEFTLNTNNTEIFVQYQLPPN